MGVSVEGSTRVSASASTADSVSTTGSAGGSLADSADVVTRDGDGDGGSGGLGGMSRSAGNGGGGPGSGMFRGVFFTALFAVLLLVPSLGLFTDGRFGVGRGFVPRAAATSAATCGFGGTGLTCPRALPASPSGGFG
ncbi:hypothetical protein GCM10017690_22500 [Microbacterium terregens]